MRDFLEALAVAFLASAACLALGVAVVVRRLHRANQLAPHRPGSAPLHWQWSWRRAAQQHRRLRRACHLAASAAGYQGPAAASGDGSARRRRRRPKAPRSPLVGVAEGLIAHALTLDSELVMADRLGSGWRRSRLAGLEVEVRRVEAAAERMARLSVAWQEHLRTSITDTSRPSPVVDLDSRLDAMEAALDDLSAPAPILGRLSPVGRPTLGAESTLGAHRAASTQLEN